MARLIPQKQIEEINQFKDSISVANSVFISGSLLVSQSIDIGSTADTIQRITGSVEITGSLELDGQLSFKDAQSRLDATSSFSDESVDTQRFGGISVTEFGGSDATIYVSATRGDDTNDGRSPQFPLRTIKKAAELATPGDDGRFGLDTGSNFTGFRIDVDTGNYVEDNPIELPRNTTVWGSGLRVTKIIAKNENEDLFWVNSGCYLAEMTFAGLRVYPSVDVAAKGFAIAFAPNAFITTSPYVQNCSMISNQENSFLEAYEEIPAGGGGLNVDGNRIHPDSPLASMVLDAYTQIAPNGVGCQVVGRGFIQLVSFFTNFSAYSVKVIDGGQAVLLNSNTSFGDYGMYASGSRFITGSGGNQNAFINVQNNYSIIVDTIEDGLSAIPPLVTNTENGYRATDPNVIPQYFTSADSNAEVAEIAKSDFRLVTSVIENGDTNEVALVAKSSTTGYSSASVYNISGDTQITSSLTASVSDIQKIDTNYTIVLDIIDRGNAATSSYTQAENTSASIYVGDVEQYKSGIAVTSTTKQIVGDRFDEVIDIITNGPTFADTLITNTSASFKFSSETPYETDVISSDSIVQSISESISIVYNILDNGTGSNVVPTIVPSSSIANPTVEYQNAYELLINNIPFIQEETILYLSSSWSEFEYNQETCKRDVGYIVSGAAHDLLYGGNEESVRSGIFYYQYPSDATTTQKDPTLTAIKYVRGLTENILKNKTFRDTNSDIDNGYDVLFNNKDFIREETIAYLSSSWSTFDYNEAKCRRDLGYIIDAVGTDLLYDGNERTLEAGNFYYKYPSLATTDNRTDGQKQQTLDGIKYAKRLSQKLVNNETFVTASQSIQAAADLARKNRSLIQDETITYINTKYPTFSYNEAKCRRDTGYIIDNVITDLVYGGNERSELAGLYYYLYPSIANTTQLEETLEGIRYSQGFLREIVLSNNISTPQIVLNTDGNIRVTSYTPTTGSISGGETEIQIVSQSFGIIEDIIRYGDSNVLGAIAANSSDIEWTTTSPVNTSGRNQITSSTSFDNTYTESISSNYETVIKIIESGSSITTEETIGTDSKGNPISTVGIPKNSYGDNLVKTVTGVNIPNEITIVKNTDSAIKFNNNNQYTASVTASSVEVAKVSSSFAVVSDIIEFGITGSRIISGSSDASTYFEVVTLDSNYNAFYFNKNQLSKFDDIDGKDLPEDSGSYDDGIKDPTLTLKRGELYTFSINSLNIVDGGSINPDERQPFYIKTQRKSGTEFQYTTGITNNGTTFGTLTFIVPFDAPDRLFYVNGNNVSASGVIDIVDNLPLSDTQRYIDVPSKGEIEVVYNTIDNIKVTDNIQFSSSFSASVNDTHNVSSSFATVIDVLENGLDNLPTVVSNITGSIKKSNISQYTSSTDATVGIRNIVTSSFDTIIDILENGTDNIPTLDDNVSDLIKVTSTNQLTSSVSAGDYEVGLVSSSYATIIDVLFNGLGNLPSEILNTSASIKVTNTPQYISASSVSSEEINKVSSSFAIVLDIVENGTGSIPTIVENVNENIKVGNIGQYISSSYSGSLEDVSYLSSSFAIVTSIIKNGLNSAPTLVDYTTRLTTENAIASYEILKENIDFIQEETIAYLSSSWSTASYDEQKCRRDVGFIVSGAAEDLIWNANSASVVNGKFYFENPSLAETSQINQTLDGINYASRLAQKLIQNIEFVTASEERLLTQTLLTENTPFIQNETISYLSSSWSTFDYNEVTCKRDINYIIDAVKTDIVYGGNERSANAGEFYYLYPSDATGSQLQQTLDGIDYARRLADKVIQNVEFITSSNEASASHQLLRDNKQFIQDETIAYISASWSDFDYVESTCKRDVGYIIDAVATDTLYGGNERTVEAARYYYLYPSDATGSQLSQTTDAINYARRLSENIIVNTQFASAPFSRTNGYDLIFKNRNLIQTEVVEYISSSWADFEYDDVKCARDVGYILDAVSTDLLYGGNERSRVAGEFYYLYPSDATGSQLTQTVDGVKWAKSMTDEILQNNLFVTASEQKLAVASLITENKQLIQDETIAYLSSSWSTFDYNESKCKRDVGYILDAVVTDFVYGGNERSAKAGEFYYLYPSEATGSQLSQTSDGVSFASRLTNKLITNTTLVSPSIERQSTYDLLFENKSFIQDEVISYISSSWSGFDYIESKCRRDTGYIIDAVATDTLYGGNERSVTAGEFYYLFPSEATGSQLQQTLDGVRHAAGVADKLIENTIFTTASLDKKQSYDLILDNKDLIQDNVIDFIDQTYPYFTYNRTKCRRDTGYIIDAVVTDLLYGGNQRSVVAGVYYYLYPSEATTTQIIETVQAIRYADSISKKVVQNEELVTPSISKNTENNIRFTNSTQYTDSLAISGSEVLEISSSFETVTGIITDGVKSFTPTDASYDPSSGDFVITIANHSLSTSNGIWIKPNSFTFTCEMDGNRTEHILPSLGQPAYNNRLPITATTSDTITVNVGKSGPNIEFNPTNASYDPATGDFVVTVGTHSLSVGEGIVMEPESFAFTCDMDDNQSVKSYPRVGIDPKAVRSIPLTAVTDTTLTFNVGASGPNKYFTPVSASYNALTGDMTLTVSESFGLGVGRSVVLEDESFAFTCDQDGDTTTHSYPRPGSDPYAGKSIVITSVGTTTHTITDAPYDSATGDVTITIANHGFSNGDYIKLDDNSLTYTCVLDGNTTTKSYPRPNYDYPSGRWLEISNVTTNTFDINIGSSPYVGAHTFVSATADGLERQDGTFTINVGNAGSASGSLHTFVSASNNAVKHEPQSVHTFVSASNGALKHLPQSTHTFVRTVENSISTVPYETKNIESLTKVNNIEQFTLSTSGSSTEVGIVSASIDLINDIIRLGTDNIPFTIAKHFQTSELDTPQQLTTGSYTQITGPTLDSEYNNGSIISLTGDGSDFFKKEVTVNGVRIVVAGDVGGQTAVPDAFTEKVARMFELFTDPSGSGINETFQRNLIKTLSGDSGTYHAGLPTIQRVARGAGSDYTPNFLDDAGILYWNLTNLLDTHVQNDMVWYLNSTGDISGSGDIDAQEVIEHIFHTLHMHGLPADDIKLYSYLASDWQTGDLYLAMEEAYDAGLWDSSGYGGNSWKTDSDAFEVAAKEYLYLLNFSMFEYTDLWENGSLSPEWDDSMRTQAGILANNPLGYAFHNTYISPTISKPSLATIRSIFQDGDLGDPTIAGESGYVVTPTGTYDVTDELVIVSSSVKIVNDIIQSGTGSLPTQISNTSNTIKVGTVDQFIGVQSGSLTEIDLVKNRAGIIENVVQNGTGSLPILVRTNSDITNLIKYTDSSQITGSSGDKVQEKIISSSFGIVVDILNNGTGSLPTLVDYETRIDAPKSVNAYNLLKDNIEFIQDETIAFLSSSWTEFDYNEAKCRRDLGFIISGAAEDLIWNANSSSIVNGKFYYEYPSQATGSQLQQTLDGIIYASNMAQNIVRGRTYVTASQNVSASFELLRNNREFIKEETIAFVSSSWSDFYYSESKCRRDTGYIVDAIATDLLYGGNERSTIAAEYYYRYPSAAIVGGVPNENQQKDPTVTAINYIKGLVGELVSGSTFVSPSNEVEYTYDSIRENRQFIQNETVAFINAKYPDLIYNEASCSRDTGFIVDAIATDLRWGGNQRSITAGEFYYKFPSKAISSQASSTIDGVVYIKDLIESIANKETLSVPQRTLNTDSNIKFLTHNQFTGSLSGSLENIAFVSSSIDIVTTIIANGTGSYETASLYGVRSTDPSTLAAYEIIKENIDFIKDETIAYLSSSWSTSSYNEEKCKRDVGFIISGAAEDLVYNTYSASIVNGKFYYEYPSEANGTGSQINQTLDGIFYASRITQKLIQNIEFETASLEVSSSYNLIRENRQFIQSESISYLSSSWSSFDYNEEKCKRDITHIIDAVSTDILYGGNERSITAGNFYYKYPSSATTAQVDPTTTGINYAGDLMENLIQNNEFVTATAERIAGNKTLLENRSFIQNEVIAYISSSWSGFEYNEASCSRDTGYIVDAVATDLLYGGNERSRTAGEYYYLYPSEATTTQANQTTDGVKYASGIAQKLVQNIEFVTASNEVSASWNLLRDNKEFIQNEVIAFVSSSWSGVYYDEEKCKRDVGFLIDATATDLFYGGNERSVTAGSYYWRYPSRATNKGVPSEENQLDPTVDGIRYAKGLSQKVIQNTEFTTPTNSTLVGAELLIGNKNLIQNEVITFLSSSWSEFEYNQEKCFRDVGYIIDAVRTDMVYGGNERSLQAGRFYYYIPSVAITEQKPQTIDGIDFAKGLAERVILKDQLTRAPFNTRVSVDLLRANKKVLQGKAISYTNGAFPDFVYNEEKCYRDTGFIVDAIATDLLYGGNERSIEAAKSYYNGVYGDASAVVNEQKYETAETNRFLRTQFQRIVRNSPLELFGSLIITTGHDFSYAGSGVTYKALPPNQGGAGVPDPTKEITEIGGGRVYFTSGNELGDFRIGAGLVINQATGTLQGRTFSRSLFSLVTPFSLALQD